MNALTFHVDWIEGAAASSAEELSTFGTLTLAAGDRLVTRHIDYATRQIHDGIPLPVYAVAEWFASRWWFLLYETEWRRSDDTDEYRTRHVFPHRFDRWPVPDLVIRRDGGTIHLQWRAVLREPPGVAFTTGGVVDVPVDAFRTAVLTFLRRVNARLDHHGIHGTLLQQQIRRIESTASEDESLYAATAALGLDPSILASSQGEPIRAVVGRVPQAVHGEFFSIANFSRLETDTTAMLKGIRAARTTHGNLDALRRLKAEMQRRGLVEPLPATGRALARELRRRRGPWRGVSKSLVALARQFGLEAQHLAEAVTFVLDSDSPIDAIIDGNTTNSPGFALRRDEPHIWFTLSRAVGEYLVTPDGEPALVTRSRCGRQRENRAFAAEMLVPADVLRGVRPMDHLNDDDIDDLAMRFAVPASVIRHQLERPAAHLHGD